MPGVRVWSVVRTSRWENDAPSGSSTARSKDLPGSLKRKLHRQLNTARSAGTGVDRTRPAAQRAGYSSEVRVVRGAASGVRIGKLRRIGRIHSFQPKLHLEPFAELRTLGQSGIQIKESRPGHGIPSHVASLLGSAANLIGSAGWAGRRRCRRLAGWRGKCRCIEPRAPAI